MKDLLHVLYLPAGTVSLRERLVADKPFASARKSTCCQRISMRMSGLGNVGIAVLADPYHRVYSTAAHQDLDPGTLQNWLVYSTATGDRRAHTGDTTSAAASLVHPQMRKKGQRSISLFHRARLSELMKSVRGYRSSLLVLSRSSLSRCRELLCSIHRWRSG
jgi:hypothetical protein